MTAANPGVVLAFVAGLLSFLSPCCLPLYPSYLSYISGISVEELQAGAPATRRKALVHAIWFLAGFSTVFVALGLSTSLLGSFFTANQKLIQRVGGVLVVAMGLSLLGLLPIGFLRREARITFSRLPQGYLGSLLFGLSFAAGWTPCIGPIMASILVLAATNPGTGGVLMGAYALGFSIPFLILAYMVGSLPFFRRYARVVDRVSGALLIVMGTLLFTGQMSRLTAWLIGLYGGWVGF